VIVSSIVNTARSPFEVLKRTEDVNLIVSTDSILLSKYFYCLEVFIKLRLGLELKYKDGSMV